MYYLQRAFVPAPTMTSPPIGSETIDNCNMPQGTKPVRLFYLFSLVLCLGLLHSLPAKASTDNDFQQWSLIFTNHHLNDKWSASMQMENRLRDDASEVDKQIFKPGGYYAFTDTLKLGVGYKYVRKKDSKDEQDPWQELFFNPAPIGNWDWAHQFRWEQRTGGGVGRKMSKKLKVEVGYLWNYQREREGPNLSNHVLRLQFRVDTKGLHPLD